MIKFAIAGKLDYFKKSKELLVKNNYIPALEIKNSKVIDYKDVILNKNLDLLVCVAHPYILTKEELDLFPKGCINFHTGIPDYCGRHPVNWMIIDGVKKIPVSVHYMTEEIDGGDIIIENSFQVNRDEDYNTIMKKITDSAAELVLLSVKQIESNKVKRKKQMKSRKYPKRRTPEDSAINWSKSSYELHNFVNALVDPMPNAFTYTKDGKKIQFKRSYRGNEIGEVLAETIDGKYIISTLDGVMLVDTDIKLKKGDKLRVKT